MNTTTKKIVLLFGLLFTIGMAYSQNTYYWFGGAGDWTQVNHWSLTSGNSGGVLAPQVPTASDHVVFDNNSGFGTTDANRRVTFNLEANCNNFTVATTAGNNAPRFTGTAILNVYGSFVLSANTGWVKSNGTNFTGTGTKNIATNNVGLTGGVIILNGTYSLTGPLTTTGSVTVSAGSTFTTNNHTVNTTNVSHSGHMNLGSSAINCSGQWSSLAGATVNAGTSHIRVNGGTNFWNGWDGFASISGLTWYDVTFATATLASLNSSCTFNNVAFTQKGVFHIRGNNTFQNLTLSPGSTFAFNGSHTQTILGAFTANTPNCEGLMEIERYTTGGAVATIIASGTTNIANARITGMTASGGTFNVTGIDNGGNIGFTFTSPAPKTIYWVGVADGNWNNQANWSATSGGAGGYCIPTQLDNVIFDSNSNASVPVAIPASSQAYCHDITVTGWTGGTLVLTGGTNSGLTIFGANRWRNGMTYSVPVTTYQSVDMGEPLVFDGVEQRSATYFSGTGGWVFQDDFNTGTGTLRDLWLERGTLNTNNRSVYLEGSFYSAENSTYATSARTLLLGSSVLNVRTWHTWHNGGSTANYTLNAGTSHIIVRVGLILPTTSEGGFRPIDGQTFYNVTMLPANAIFRGNNLTFNNVKAEGNLLMVGNKTYQRLELAPGKTYTIQNTHTVQQELIVGSPACTAMMELSGSNVARFSMPASAIDVVANNVRMQNLAAIGGNSFTANGVDLGGNTGWTFAASTSKTLYWIGGTGQWNDPAHWTLNADGTASGGCVPSQYDDVVFNQFSGPGTSPITVTIADTPAYFRNMNWVGGAPVGATITTTQLINCYGSMAMGQNMAWSGNSIMHFRSPSMGQTVAFNGATSNIAVEFNSVTGGWQFQDYVKFAGSISGVALRAGALDFNGNNAEFTGFHANDYAGRQLNIAGSQITVSVDWNFVGNQGTVNASGSTVSVGRSFISGAGFQWGDVVIRSNFAGNFTGGGSAYNKVWIRKSTTVSGNNTMKVMEVDQNQITITLTAGSIQTIEDMLYLSGTPCQSNTLVSSAGTPANLRVLNGNALFDYVNVQNINASGLPLTFERNSQNNGGTTNISFVTSGSAGLVGLGPDWQCHQMDPMTASTYTLDASGFFGGATSTYSWTKVGDPAHPEVLGTGSTLNILTTGYGTYRVSVDYKGGSSCVVSDDMVVFQRTAVPIANASQRMCRNSAATVDKLTATGTALKWYNVSSGGTALASNVSLVSGTTYYVTQTLNSCESNRVPVVVTLYSCMVNLNHGLRSKVK